ncbi:MAG TPA: hypothetical protein VHJ82_08130, partial [Actinomycetota bacterium]|nr:hypothetical protein [Actinomycetota bacterium]
MGRTTASRVALAIIIVAATLAGGLPRSFAQASGSELVEEVASHEYGANAQVRLKDASGFAASGGDAIFEPGTQNEEAFSYDSVDYDTNRLIGLTRPNATGHPVGSFVESLEPATDPPEESPSPSPTPTQSETTTPSDSGSSTPIDEGDSAAPSSDEASTSAGVIPGPCDIVSALCAVVPPIDVGCEGCDTLVEEILDLVRPCLEKSGCAEPVMAVVRTLVYEACGTDDPLYCEDKYSRLIYELVDQLCPYGLTTCADPYVNFVADLIMGIVCPSGSLGYCAGELNRQVNEQLAVVVGIAKSYVVYACGGETTTDCANRVLDILYKTILPIVCQAGDAFTCVDNIADTINDVVANACSLEKSALDSSEGSATTECVSRVLATVQLVIKTANDAMIIACQSTDANTCLRNLLETVDETLSTACSFIPGLSTTPGANRCVERTLALVDLAVEIA